ncbi:MAG TPA: CopG family transcriptional regulator [Candidatus Dormibacteraeota bacterium]|nr:CopG family transcriptional regulator [Candidatus Dormibacteraeota bacterium]
MMVRKQVYLEEAQEARLKERARLLGTTEAELIRLALDRALEEPGGLVSTREFQRFLEYASTRDQLDVEASPRDWRRDDLYGR